MKTVTIRTSLATLTLLAAFTLAGAGCSGTTPPVDESDGPQAPQLAGRWVSDCTSSPGADGSTQYFRLDFDIAAASWALDYRVHADDRCTQPLVTIHIAGPYEIERPSAGVADAWEARFGFSTKTIRPEVDGLRDYLDSLEGCGTTDFETGVAQDVLTSGCPGLGQYPASSCGADYDIVKLEGDVLQFGSRPADNDMCSPDKRPAELSPVLNHRS
ncbi:MAG: hypothetical protein R3B72_26705 [Polyangiaceae bacterium]